MKKTLLSFIAGVLLTVGMASCGEKLLTEEQVQAEILKGVEAGKGTIETDQKAKCDAEFEARVTAEVELLKAAAQETPTVQ